MAVDLQGDIYIFYVLACAEQLLDLPHSLEALSHEYGRDCDDKIRYNSNIEIEKNAI